MSVFGIADWGPLVVETDVDDAIIAVLQEWLPTYLTQLSSERALGYALPAPRSYANALGQHEFMDHQLPAVLVTTAKTKSTRGGANLFYEAVWVVQVSVVVRGRSARETRLTAALFSGAIRRTMLHKARSNPGIGQTSSILSRVGWVGSEVGPIPDSTRQGRYLAAGISTYNVSTDRAAQSFGGPDIPNADAYTGLATVDEIDISFEAVTSDQDTQESTE